MHFFNVLLCLALIIQCSAIFKTSLLEIFKDGGYLNMVIKCHMTNLNEILIKIRAKINHQIGMGPEKAAVRKLFLHIAFFCRQFNPEFLVQLSCLCQQSKLRDYADIHIFVLPN